MRPIAGFNMIEPAHGGGNRLPAGGYVIRIDNVTDEVNRNGKGFLRFTFDINEGEHAGCFSDQWSKDNPYVHQFDRYYEDKSAPFFKALIEDIEESNPGYHWDWNERGLAGKIVGALFCDVEKTKDDGSVVNYTEFASSKTVEDIRSGKFTVPKKKSIGKDGQTAEPKKPIIIYPDDDIPF